MSAAGQCSDQRISAPCSMCCMLVLCLAKRPHCSVAATSAPQPALWKVWVAACHNAIGSSDHSMLEAPNERSWRCRILLTKEWSICWRQNPLIRQMLTMTQWTVECTSVLMLNPGQESYPGKLSRRSLVVDAQTLITIPTSYHFLGFCRSWIRCGKPLQYWEHISTGRWSILLRWLPLLYWRYFSPEQR